MPGCAIFNCAHHSGKDKIGFYGIPSIIRGQCDKTLELSTRRRSVWLARINRADIKDENITRDCRVCSKHFVSGKPSALFDVNNVDWAPSIDLGYESRPRNTTGLNCNENRSVQSRNQGRYERAKGRSLKRTKDFPIQVQRPHKIAHKTGETKGMASCSETTSESTVVGCAVETVESDVSAVQNVVSDFVQGLDSASNSKASSSVSCKDVACQSEYETFEQLEKKYFQVFEDNVALRKEKEGLSSSLLKCSLTEESLRNDDEKVRFYTGLPTFTLLMHVFHLVSSAIPSFYRNALPKFSEFMIVLMRLRLGLLEDDLAYRFQVAQSTISAIFYKWIRAMAGRLQELIIWPERDILHLTMPVCFKKQFGNSICVIIDCFELFTDRPQSLAPRAETWSNYKQHNTVKFLIGITPQGTVSFISNGWVGRASDQEITRKSGLLDMLIPGDVILADRGFTIFEDVGMYQAKLQIPAFTKGKTQLSSGEVQETREIANVRIHVERVIGLLKRKFRILKNTILVSLTTPQVGDDLAPIDMMVRVCCALVNLCPSVVSSGAEDDKSVRKSVGDKS